MKLISTTITNSRADVISAAIAAVAPHVDEVHVIDTGATDDTMRLAAAAAGDKFRAHAWRWRDDFAAARNEALRIARATGADWALTADTDEILHLGETPAETRAFLASCGVAAVTVPHASRQFGHQRFYRPATPGLVWREPVHEVLLGIPSCCDAPPSWHFETP